MMRALKCAYGLGVEGGHRIANWLLEGSRPGASQLRIEALFSVGASAKKRAQWAREPRKTETQGHPLACSSPLPSRAGEKERKKIKSAGKIDQCGETPRPQGDGVAFPFRGWRAERKGMALLCHFKTFCLSPRLVSLVGCLLPFAAFFFFFFHLKPRPSFPLLFRLPPPRMETCRRST
jgi:hypothetical protein